MILEGNESIPLRFLATNRATMSCQSSHQGSCRKAESHFDAFRTRFLALP